MDGVAETKPPEPRTTSPLAAHLARFRYASPHSSPSSATPPKPLVRKRSTGTPPRADGSSPYFQRRFREEDTTSIHDDDVTDGAGQEEDLPQKKKRKRPARPFADASVYAHLGEDPLTDYMVEDGQLMLCGINPGRLSAEKGLHYANPTNHYWRCLSGSGLTDRLLDPSEGPLLPVDYGISATNLVPRPTAEMSEISNEEMKACVPSLLRKIIKYRPRVVAFVGMKICEIVLRYLHNAPSADPEKSPSKKRKPAMPKVKIGLQPVTISVPLPAHEAERRKIYIWCLPSTSARVVEYQLTDKIAIFTRLKTDIDTLLASPPPHTLKTPVETVDYRAEDVVPPAEEGSTKVEDGEEGEVEKLRGRAGGEAPARKWTVTLVSAADVANGGSPGRMKEENP
ncbi:hypothetical protein JCM11251_006694 [Rhodosporidiobolus azoricus]